MSSDPLLTAVFLSQNQILQPQKHFQGFKKKGTQQHFQKRTELPKTKEIHPTLHG